MSNRHGPTRHCREYFVDWISNVVLYFRLVTGRTGFRGRFLTPSGEEYMTVAVTTKLAPTKNEMVG